MNRVPKKRVFTLDNDYSTATITGEDGIKVHSFGFKRPKYADEDYAEERVCHITPFVEIGSVNGYLFGQLKYCDPQYHPK